jgi:predicted GNAT superfamily acetyltransferase
LKLLQRDEARGRRIGLIEWTFDPLELKNAFFNLERLGAVVRRFVPNQYGTTSSHLHGGLPTDRCIAEWWIDSDRVNGLLDGKPEPKADVVARIEIPVGIADIRVRDPQTAREIQTAVREQFLRHLRSGLEVVGFDRTVETGAYLLAERRDDQGKEQ